MPKFIWWILCIWLIFVLSACTENTRVNLGMGVARSFANEDYEWKGSDPSVMLRVEQPVTERTSCEYMHVSNLFDGPPFSSDPESSLDWIGCSFQLHPEEDLF